MNQPIFLPTGAWCLWDSAQQLPLYLGKPWRDIFSELSKNVGLKEATAEMLAALDAPSRWEDVLREVEKDKGKIAATALKRLTRNGPPVRVCASVIRAELTRDRDQERREALEAQRGQNISIAKRKKKQAAASKEVTVVADRKSRKEIEPTVEQIANPEWEWDSLANIARACGDRDRDSIRYRFTSDASKWMHYETAPADEIEGKWDKRAKFVYRIRPGYPIHALNDEQQQQLREELGETIEEVDEVAHQVVEDDAPARDESVKADARIATLETALITAREKIADLEASLEDAKTYCDERDDRIEALEAELAESKKAPRTDDADHYMRRAHKAEDALQRIAELAEQHTSFTADEIGTDDLVELLAAAFEDASKASRIEGALLSIRQLVREQTRDARWLEPDDLHRLLTATFEDLASARKDAAQFSAEFESSSALLSKAKEKIKELEQLLAAHRDVSSSMVELKQPNLSAQDTERINRFQQTLERTGAMILKAEQVNAAFEAERFEAILSQGFDMVRDLYRAGVHLPVELSAWLWEAQETLRDAVEGAA